MIYLREIKIDMENQLFPKQTVLQMVGNELEGTLEHDGKCQTIAISRGK